MKITELVDLLDQIKEVEGDVEVVFMESDELNAHEISYVELKHNFYTGCSSAIIVSHVPVSLI
jgi:hypothetical protein